MPHFVVHWGQLPRPAGPDAAIEPVLNALVHVVQCQPLDYAVATLDSALHNRRTSLEELNQLAHMLGGRFARTVAAVDGRADAGGESLMRVRLAASGIVMVPQVYVDGHPVDGLIGSRLIVQVDGFEFHGDPVRRARDLAQDRRLNLRGYTVFRYPSHAVENRWPEVQEEILDAVAQGLHESSHRSR